MAKGTKASGQKGTNPALDRKLYPWPLRNGPPTAAEMEAERQLFAGPAPRIASISIKGFRAFCNEEYTIDLGAQGKNLLLFGENGAGKSSLYKALEGILDDQTPAFEKHQNIFHAEYDDHVTVKWTAGTPSDMVWEAGRLYPHREHLGRIHELRRRVTLLSYKDLAKLHTAERGTAELDIFDLLIDKLLRHVDLPSGDSVFMRYVSMKYVAESTVREGLRSAKKSKLAEARILQLRLEDDAFTFFMELSELLTVGPHSIVARANELLKTLVPGLAISIRQVQPTKKGEGSAPRLFVKVRDIHLHCTFYGRTVELPGIFLNEARLTAIALCLYLAGAERSLPIGSGQRTRVLVLDDILIGLDMAHRIPVLKLLQEQFADWQILLFTHDRVWYDMARAYTRGASDWAYYELVSLPGQVDTPPRPYLKQGQDHLQRANQLLAEYDLMAAAVHARAEFEELIKRKCEKYGRPVQYHQDPKDYKADKFWEALKADKRPVHGSATKMGPTLIAEVEMVRSNVLNKLSHGGSTNLMKVDVEQALALMPRLRAALDG